VSSIPPSQWALSLHHLAIPFGRLIFGKAIKIASTIGQILRLKCTLSLSAPDPTGELTALAGFKGPTSKGSVGRKEKVMGENVEPHTVE